MVYKSDSLYIKGITIQKLDQIGKYAYIQKGMPHLHPFDLLRHCSRRFFTGTLIGDYCRIINGK